MVLQTSSWLAATGNATRTVTYEGTPLHYDLHRADSGVAVVFVHGAACRRSFWANQVEALVGRATIVNVDLVGHGDSQPADGRFTMSRFARGVLATLDDAGVDQAIVVGHSMGAAVARQVYRAAPERVLGIVLVDGLFVLENPDAFRGFLAAYETNYESIWPRFVDSMISPGAEEAVRAQIRDSMLGAPKPMVMSLLEEMYAAEVWAPLEVDVPVLALMAGNGQIPPAYPDWLRSSVPQVNYRVVPDTGHFLQMEDPEAVNGPLLEFVEEVLASRRP